MISQPSVALCSLNGLGKERRAALLHSLVPSCRLTRELLPTEMQRDISVPGQGDDGAIFELTEPPQRSSVRTSATIIEGAEWHAAHRTLG